MNLQSRKKSARHGRNTSQDKNAIIKSVAITTRTIQKYKAISPEVKKMVTCSRCRATRLDVAANGAFQDFLPLTCSFFKQTLFILSTNLAQSFYVGWGLYEFYRSSSPNETRTHAYIGGTWLRWVKEVGQKYGSCNHEYRFMVVKSAHYSEAECRAFRVSPSAP